MDFFARQDASRRSTRRLVLLFGIAFLIVAGATAFVVTAAFGYFGDATVSSMQAPRGFGLTPDWRVVAGVMAGTLLLMIIASLYRSATLSNGGGRVAAMLGGTRIHGDETDPIHRRLINVVEEMSIASGVPVPEIYVLEREAGINAFAAGLGHADAAIAVTRGSLEQLTRSELRGVIAHEFSHILNGDMRLNIRLMGLGYGILVLSLIGRWLLHGARYSRSSRGRGGGIAAVGFALVVIGGIGVLLSRLIKAAVSRQREVLADASAVQFTREPLALAGALKKIGGFTTYLTAAETEEVSHMLFGRGTPSFRGWFATHPPLPERIRALDPSFTEEEYPAPVEPGSDAAAGDESGVAGFAKSSSRPALNVSLDDVTLAAAGSIRGDDTASLLHAAIPEALAAAAHSVDDSLLLVVAIALAADDSSGSAAAAIVNAQLGAARAARSFGFRRELAAVDRRLWLPLVEITVPALRRRPAPQIDFMLDLVERLAAVDAEKSLFEYVLLRLLSAYLKPVSAPPPRDRAALRSALLTVVATVAVAGHGRAATARAAAAAGLAPLPADFRGDEALDATLAAAGFDTLDRALDVLAGAPAATKRTALSAIERTIRHDGRVGIEELELFRAIAAAIGVPIPPADALR